MPTPDSTEVPLAASKTMRKREIWGVPRLANSLHKTGTRTAKEEHRARETKMSSFPKDMQFPERKQGPK